MSSHAYIDEGNDLAALLESGDWRVGTVHKPGSPLSKVAHWYDNGQRRPRCGRAVTRPITTSLRVAEPQMPEVMPRPCPDCIENGPLPDFVAYFQS